MKLIKQRRLVLVIAVAFMLSCVFMSACDSSSSAPAGSTPPATTAPADTPTGDSDEHYIMRMGVGAGGGNPQVKFMEEFKIEAEAASGGRLTVETYPSGQLGTLAQMIQGVQDGSVGGYLMPTNYYSTIVPELEVLDMPSFWEDTAHITKAMMENETSLSPLLEDAGVIPMAWVYLNDQIIASNRNLTTLADFKGGKTWCNPGQLVTLTVEAIGLTPSLLDSGEVTSALQNGTVDMALAGAPFFFPYNIQDVTKYLVLTPKQATCSLFAVSKTWFDTMPADIQQIIRDSATKVNTEIVFDYGIGFQQTCIDNMVDAGMTLIEPEGALKAELDAAYSDVPAKYLAANPDKQAIFDEIKALADKTRP